MNEEMVIETAKAAQEVSKAVQSVAGLADKTGNFIGKIVGPAADALGGLLGDQCKSFRAANLYRLSLKWEEKVKERNINEDILKHLPFGVSYRALEVASMEEDESVQELWAELFASATDPNRNVEVKKVYIDILKSISAPEAALLNLLWEVNKDGPNVRHDEIPAFEGRINELANSTWRKFSKTDRNTAIQNLVRLRCITFRPSAPHLNRLFDMPRAIETPWPRDCALVNVKQFESLMKYFEDTIMMAAGIKEFNASDGIQISHGVFGTGQKIKVQELNYLLTPAGKDLLQACKEEIK